MGQLLLQKAFACMFLLESSHICLKMQWKLGNVVLNLDICESNQKVKNFLLWKRKRTIGGNEESVPPYENYFRLKML